jgi:hypothetical protein
LDFPYLSDSDIKPHIIKQQQSIAKVPSGSIIKLSDGKLIKYETINGFEPRDFFKISIEIYPKVRSKKKVEGVSIMKSKASPNKYNINSLTTNGKTTSIFCIF